MPRIVYVLLAASALAAAAVFVVPAGGEQAHPLSLTAEAGPASSVAPPTTLPAPTTVTVRQKPTVTTTDTKPRPVRQAPRAATPARPGPCAGWETLIAAYFPANQVTKGCSVVMCESGGNPRARNPGPPWASGLWQVIRSTWARHGGYTEAYLAPPEVQTEKALMLWKAHGWRPWVCA